MFSQSRFTHIKLKELHHIETSQQIKFIDVQILRIIVQQRGANNLAYTYSNTCAKNKGFNQSKFTTLDIFLSVFSTKLRWANLPTSFKLKVSIRQFGTGKLN